MNKSVLISIRPKWCELIASEKKTIEVRKTAPEEVPFKAYIYCTKGKAQSRCGKVIGEFVCDRVYKWECKNRLEILESFPIWRASYMLFVDDLEKTCLTYDDLWDYGNGKPLYGWHISDLKIYDKPRELSEFWAYNEELHKRYDSDRDFCCYDDTNEYGESLTDCGDAYNNILNCYRCWEELSGWCHHVTRPPQSWMYVEELEE